MASELCGFQNDLVLSLINGVHIDFNRGNSCFKLSITVIALKQF